MKTNDQLSQIRQKIDAIDEQLQTLLNERANCALEVAKIKRASNSAAIYRPEREAQILRQIAARNTGPFSAKDLSEIFLHIMTKCRSLQKPIAISILGKTDNSAKAAKQHLGKAIQLYSNKSIKQIFKNVTAQKTQFGVVPIENANHFVHLETLQTFLEFPVQICGEINFQRQRFWLIGQDKVAPSGNDKTSLVIFITNKAGSLATILAPFAAYQINVSFIEYFPYQGNINNYVFFLDVVGHQSDSNLQQALTQLSQQALNYMILGSYPQAIL